jgi:hypothetical protein
MIKPIETVYAGCRFRSRLEARWAVFFDDLGIEWEYESQGYESRAGRYLPDFWLPDMRHWAEVKGHFTPADLAKITGAIFDLREPIDKQVTPQLLILGPVPRPGFAWAHVRLDTLLKEFMLWQQVYFTDFGGWITKAIGAPVVFQNGAFDNAPDEMADYFCKFATEVAMDDRLTVSPEVDAAYAAARAARFEFGESGAPGKAPF